MSVVPQPRRVELAPDVFTWPAHVEIRIHRKSHLNVAKQLASLLRFDHVTASVTGRDRPADIVLMQFRAREARLGDEGYVLRIRRGQINLWANTEAGLFYGVQTLAQTFVRGGGGLRSRAVTIEDWPASRWRGVHLDVARHFFARSTIERYVDLAAHYKLNRFHWHLTDDQAWRLPIDRYPALASGGLTYSKSDVRNIVAYAAQRYVTVVPEIDMPAHMSAAVRRYPFLSCAGGTLCMNAAGKTFARNVLSEVLASFPGPYVHAGGDEVPPKIRSLQPAFTSELDKFVAARERRLMGWDEIFTPALSKRAIVTVWTQRAKAVEVARRGNDAILASGPLYFDGAQGDMSQEPTGNGHMATLEEVYSYGGVPEGTAAAVSVHILGVQANMWTERIASEQKLFYMAFPRELALAEIAWSARRRRNWESFLRRLPDQLAWLEARHVAFRIPNASFALAGNGLAFAPIAGRVQAVRAWTNAPSVSVTLTVPLRDGLIHYSTDGSDPRVAARVYRRPFDVFVGSRPTRIRAVVTFGGRIGTITECNVSRPAPSGMPRGNGISKSWSALVSP